MANSSIGTAWIQIKPSLKGVSNDIKKALGEGGDKLGTEFNGKFKNSFLTAAKQSFSEGFAEFGRRSDAAFASFKNALAGVSIGIGGAVVYAVKQFGEYEQLIGGVDKLFKESSDIVQQYARDSYKTTQLSANKYMETITGFSASLLKGLGGDTKKAAMIGNTAISDMSDNANTFGTSIESIQFAYQGFAKQNFTMLDNLKLGYGGTQSEMAKLINDSKVMNDGFKATAENVKDIPFFKMIEAIHKIQTEQGIAGTSAKEASKTILGSWNMSKAAFEDMMTSLSDPNGNFEAALGNFTTSAKIFVSNLSPILAKVVDNIMAEIERVSPEAAKVLKDVGGALSGALDWAKNNQETVSTILKLVIAFKALQIATGGIRAIGATLGPWAKLAKGTFQAAAGGVQAITGKLKGLGGTSKATEQVSAGVDKMTNSVKKAPKTFAFGDSIASFFKNIGTALSGVADSVVKPLQTLLKGTGEAVAGFFKTLASPQVLIGAVMFAAAAGAVALAILMIGSAIVAIAPGLGDFLQLVLIPFGTFLVGVLLLALAAVTTALVRLTTEAVVPLVTAVAGGLIGAFDAVGRVISSAGTAVSGVVDSIAGGIARVLREVRGLITDVGRQDWYGTGYGITRNFSAGLIDGLIDLLQDSLNKIINNVINIPGIGKALESVGVKSDMVNLSSFKLGRRANGGSVFGAGSATSDSIPMALSNGEYVIRAAAAKKIGYSNLDNLNSSGDMGGSGGGDVYQIYPPAEFAGDYDTLAEYISKKIALKKGRVIG